MKKILLAMILAMTCVVVTTTLAFAYGDDDDDDHHSETTTVYNITMEGSVVTFLTEECDPLAGVTVQLKETSNDKKSLAEGVTEDDGTFDIEPYSEYAVTVLSVSNGDDTILYYLETGEYELDDSDDDKKMEQSSIDTDLAYKVTIAVCVLVIFGLVIALIRQDKKAKKRFAERQQAKAQQEKTNI